MLNFRKNNIDFDEQQLLFDLSTSKSKKDIAFAEVYRLYSQQIIKYCQYMDASSVEDTFQDVFISFYKVKNYDNIKSIKAYLYTIARNLVYNEYRFKKSTVLIDDIIETIPANNRLSDDKEFVSTAIEMLKPEFKEIIILKEIDGLKYDEIASLIGINASAAKARCRRAKMKLVEIMKPMYDELTGITK